MIEIVAPARFVERATLSLAVSRATQAGLTIFVSPGCHMRDGQFAGSDQHRASDLVRAWNGNAEILWCARGGYGAGRLLSLIRGQLGPVAKTLIGYSDQTYLLAHIAKNRLGKAVHGPMPMELQVPGKHAAIDDLLGCIARNDFSFRWQSECGALREGEARGRVIVGTLAILTRLIGTADEPDWQGAILFVEDVEEYFYAIDRMFLHLAEAGVLRRIAGLVLGSFTACLDNEIPFGLTVEQMALHHLHGRDIPVATGAPIGHGTANQPIVFGAPCFMLCRGDSVSIEARG